jgi:hypothetical protein
MYRRATQLSESTSSSTQHSRSSSRSNEATSDTSNPSSDGDDFVRDPTTIVGLACRVPGAQNPSKLWDNIVEQKDLQSKIPGDRFNVDAFYHPNGANKSTVRHPIYAS